MVDKAKVDDAVAERTFHFQNIDKASEDDLSDVEGDALEDFGFHDHVSTDEFEARFENELLFSWKIEKFSEKVQEAGSTRNYRVSSEVYSFKKPTKFRNLSLSNNLSSIDGGFDASKSCEEAIIKWKLLFYPTGNHGNDTFSGKTYSSVFLAIDNADSLPKGFSVVCKVDFAAINPKRGLSGKTLASLKELEITPGIDLFYPCENTFTKESTDWGFSQFAYIDNLEQNFCVSDEVLIVCRVRQKYNIPSRLYYDSRKATDKVGLRNLGATCYLNSLLQTLFYTKSLRSEVYKVRTRYHFEEATGDEMEEDKVIESMQRLFFELEISEDAVDTKRLTRSFGWTNFDLFMQHDVQELNRQLCDKLESSFKKLGVEKNIVKELFVGQYKSYIKCINVNYESSKVEEYYDLQLDVKGMKNVYDSFENYIKVDKLVEDNQYYANEEYGKQDADKGIEFLSFPKILNLHLKRFEYNIMKDTTEKINDKYEFPVMLDLSKYIDSSSEEQFILQSVLVHSGNVNAGHYYAYINTFDGVDLEKIDKESLAENCTWYKFDDENVVHVKQKRVVEGTFGGELRRHLYKNQQLHYTVNANLSSTIPSTEEVVPIKKCTNAYMLVYIKVSELSRIASDVSAQHIPSLKLFSKNLQSELERERHLMKQKIDAKETVRILLFSTTELKQFDIEGKYCAQNGFISQDNRAHDSFALDFINVFNIENNIYMRKEKTVRDIYTKISASIDEPFALWTVELNKKGCFRVKDRLDSDSTLAISQVFSPESIQSSTVSALESLDSAKYQQEYLPTQIMLFIQLNLKVYHEEQQNKKIKLTLPLRVSGDTTPNSDIDSLKPLPSPTTTDDAPEPNLQNLTQESGALDGLLDFEKEDSILLFVKFYDMIGNHGRPEKVYFVDCVDTILSKTFKEVAGEVFFGKTFNLDIENLQVSEFVVNNKILQYDMEDVLRVHHMENGNILIFEEKGNSDGKSEKTLQQFFTEKFNCFHFKFNYFSIQAEAFNTLSSANICFDVVNFDVRLNFTILLKMLENEISNSCNQLDAKNNINLPLSVIQFISEFNSFKQILVYTNVEKIFIQDIMKSVINLPLFEFNGYYRKTQNLYFTFSPFVMDRTFVNMPNKIFTRITLLYAFDYFFMKRDPCYYQSELCLSNDFKNCEARLKEYIVNCNESLRFSSKDIAVVADNIILCVIRIQNNKYCKITIHMDHDPLRKFNVLDCATVLKPRGKLYCQVMFKSVFTPRNVPYLHSFKSVSWDQRRNSNYVSVVHFCSRASDLEKKKSDSEVPRSDQVLYKSVKPFILYVTQEDTLVTLKVQFAKLFYFLKDTPSAISWVGFKCSETSKYVLLENETEPVLSNTYLYTENEAKELVLGYPKLSTVTLGIILDDDLYRLIDNLSLKFIPQPFERAG